MPRINNDHFKAPAKITQVQKRINVWDKQSPFREYETLGCLLRDNVYPGWTYNFDRSSTSHREFNSIIFSRRHNMTDEHRMHRDWLSEYHCCYRNKKASTNNLYLLIRSFVFDNLVHMK